MSADGKRLAFVESANRSVISVLSTGITGTRGASSRKLTLTESWNRPFGWTPDSKTIIFGSNRDGSWGIYKQTLQDDTPVPITVGLQDPPLHGAVTPDGNWVLYARMESTAGSHVHQLMRLPAAGGRPEPVSVAGDFLGVSCSRYPATECVMIGPGTDQGELVFFSLSPTKGRGAELMRFDLPTAREDWEWQLSPDGTRVALFEPSEGSIHLLTLKRQQSRAISLKNWKALSNLTWAADGRSLLISNATPQGSALLRIGLRGNVRKLWQQKGDLSTMGLPSPDGRQLALMSWTVASNVWMLEDF